MKKVVSIVLNAFTNDSRVLKEAQSLKKFGYEVQVVALHEESLAEKELVKGIPIHRIRLRTRGWPKRKCVQIIKYLEFIGQVISNYRKACIFHCNDLSALPVGVIIKVFFNRDAKVVYDAHEYETEIDGLKGIEKSILVVLEKFLIRFAERVITVSDSIADEYARLYGITKPTLILNCPPFQELVEYDIFRTTFRIPREATIFLYQGGISAGRGVENILDAFRKMNDPTKVVVFMGYGPLTAHVQEVAGNCPNVYYHPAVAPDVLSRYTSSADVGLSLIENTCLSFYYCLPNKIFEYFMAGLPVIVSNLFEQRRIIRENVVGVIARENSTNGIIEAVKDICNIDKIMLRNNARKLASHYNWEAQEAVLIGLYENMNE